MEAVLGYVSATKEWTKKNEDQACGRNSG